MSAASFAIATPALMSDRRLSGADTRTLLALLSFTTPDHLECWPSRETLGSRCGITSVSRVSQILARLKRLGWIKITARQGSNLYRITPPPEPPEPCTPVCTAAVHPGMHAEETREPTRKKPPTPQGGESLASPEIPEPSPAPQLSATVPEEPTPDVATAQAIVEHLNATTHSHLPTSPNASIVRRVTKRLKTFAPQDIKAAITHGANVFRIPAAMLKPSILESLISQVKADTERHQARIAKDRAVLESLKPPPPTEATREVAISALAAMRAMLR